MCQQREEPPKFQRYTPLAGVFVGLSPVSIREAMFALGPSFTYTLHVHPRELLSMQHHLREWVGESELAHGFNVVDDHLVDPWEWYLCANNRCVGSKGA
jgi:hypothetical protein